MYLFILINIHLLIITFNDNTNDDKIITASDNETFKDYKNKMRF